MKTALALLMAAANLCAQPEPPAAQTAPLEARVEGRVVSSKNGEPVRKATVLLRAQNNNETSYATESDGNGSFAIANVEPGDYFISADRQGYWFQTAGATGAPPPRISVEKGQQMTGVVVRLTPLGAITGRILDQDGDPVRGASVEALRYVYQRGKRELQGANQVFSNDNGEYRLFGMRAGSLYVRASELRNGMGMWIISGVRQGRGGFAPTYFPGTADVGGAIAVNLPPGATVAGIDIKLRSQPMYSVRLKLPQPPENFNARIEARSAIERRFGFEETSENDTLIFPNLLPGAYIVTATRDQDGKHTLARAFVNIVDADVELGELSFSPVGDISGVVRIEGKTPAFENMQVSLRSEDRGSGGMVRPDGTFLLREVEPDTYDVTVNAVPGRYLKSIWLDDKQLPGLDLDLRETTGKLTVVLGSDVGDVEGSVVKASGDPAARARVTLIAYGKRLGRGDLSRSGFTDEKGKFHLRNVAPGEYRIFAWEDVPVGAPQDPAFRKPYEKQSTAIKMEPNGHATADLTAISLASPGN